MIFDSALPVAPGQDFRRECERVVAGQNDQAGSGDFLHLRESRPDGGQENGVGVGHLVRQIVFGGSHGELQNASRTQGRPRLLKEFPGEKTVKGGVLRFGSRLKNDVIGSGVPPHPGAGIRGDPLHAAVFPGGDRTPVQIGFDQIQNRRIGVDHVHRADRMFEDFRKRDRRGDPQRQHPFGRGMKEKRPMNLLLLGRRIGELRGDNTVFKENMIIPQTDQGDVLIRRLSLGEQGIARPLDFARPPF